MTPFACFHFGTQVWCLSEFKVSDTWELEVFSVFIFKASCLPSLPKICS